VSPDAESGAAAIAEADINGVTTIDYHHLTAGGGAGYYVGYDDAAIGEALGAGLAECVADGGAAGTAVGLVGDASTVGESAPLLAAFTQAVTKAGLEFARAVDVDEASGVERAIAELAASGVAGIGIGVGEDGGADDMSTVAEAASAGPVVASVSSGLAGIQRVLLGDQCLTIYESAQEEAAAAAELAAAIAHSDFVAADTLASAITVDPVTTAEVPTVPLEAQPVRRDEIAALVDAGEVGSEALCGSEALAVACAEAGIP
jgi:D-xylose transport system substrate-binding protein